MLSDVVETFAAKKAELIGALDRVKKPIERYDFDEEEMAEDPPEAGDLVKEKMALHQKGDYRDRVDFLTSLTMRM